MIFFGYYWAKAKMYVIGAAAVIGAFLAAFWAGKREGKVVAQAEQNKATLEGLERADKGSAEYRGNGGAIEALKRGKF